MNKYPEYIKVNNIKYKINTDFRIALKCDEIFRDPKIGNYEKTLAIIYLLLGEEGLSDYKNQGEIIKLLTKYLTCNRTEKVNDYDKEPSMDFEQDAGYIKASFMSDYKIDLDKEEMHWWQFHDLLEGLTENSVLSRVRTIREEPLSNKKGQEKARWEEAKATVALVHKKTDYEKKIDKYWEEKLK